MKKIFIFSLLMLPIATLLAIDIGGEYSVRGRNPSGGSYTGTCQIEESEEDGEYEFHWKIGGQEYHGTGTLEGNILTVDWGSDAPVIYRVSKDGSRLQGTWGANGKGRETLVRKKR